MTQDTPVTDDIYADDLTAGDTYELGEHKVTEAEIVAFAAQWDPQPFHTDPVYAEGHGFGGIIASGLHTLSIMQRLTVLRIDGRWKAIAGRKVEEAVFVHPVFPGDVLSGTMTVQAVSIDDRQRGRVTTYTELVNGEGVTVITATTVAYLRSRASIT